MLPRRKIVFPCILICAFLYTVAHIKPVMAQCNISITSPAALPSGVVGSPYSYQITATGPPTLTYVSDTGPPPGLTLSTSGLVSGTPSQAGTYSNFDVQVCSTGPGCTIADCKFKVFSITINTMSISGSVSPASIKAPSGIASAQTLTYTFTTTPAANITLASPKGTYEVGSTTIAENNTQLSANVTNGRGTKTETITISPSITQKAQSMGSTTMTYTRTFTSGSYSVTTQVDITITTEAAADFRITRMQLYFQNRMPLITIKRNDRALRAYAEMNYVGTGLLQGYWEVDGNFLTNVKRTVTTGTTITVESPTPPILPTFTSGDHVVRFVVTSPSQDIPFPEIRYYVVTEEPRPEEVKKLEPLKILFPHDRGVITYIPPNFLWTMRDGVVTYYLEFFLKGEEKPVFSAYTKRPNYRIPETFLRRFFSPGKEYAWKVRGFDNLNRTMAESAIFTFTIRE